MRKRGDASARIPVIVRGRVEDIFRCVCVYVCDGRVGERCPMERWGREDLARTLLPPRRRTTTFLTRRTILVARWRLTSWLSSDSASDEDVELEDEDASLLDFFFLCLEVLRTEKGGKGEWDVGW